MPTWLGAFPRQLGRHETETRQVSPNGAERKRNSILFDELASLDPEDEIGNERRSCYSTQVS